jgi:hypothetical protein
VAAGEELNNREQQCCTRADRQDSGQRAAAHEVDGHQDHGQLHRRGRVEPFGDDGVFGQADLGQDLQGRGGSRQKCTGVVDQCGQYQGQC